MGIDPGTATVGFGVVEFHFPNSFTYVASGVISTPKTMTTGERLKMIREDILAIIDEYSPDETAVEALFFFKNAKTLVPVAQARGVILEALACRSHIPGEYTPMQVKLQISGYGKAEKADVQWSVAQLLGLNRIVKPDDASDALAIAVCHARMHIDAGLKHSGVLKATSVKSGIKSDAISGAISGVKSGVKSDAKSDAISGAKSDAKSGVKTDFKSGLKADEKAGAKSDADANVKNAIQPPPKHSLTRV